MHLLLLYYFTMGLQDTQDLKCAGLQTYNRLDVAKLISYVGGNVSQRSKDPNLLRPGDLFTSLQIGEDGRIRIE